MDTEEGRLSLLESVTAAGGAAAGGGLGLVSKELLAVDAKGAALPVMALKSRSTSPKFLPLLIYQCAYALPGSPSNNLLAPTKCLVLQMAI
jgi:hypothetical protein